MSIRRPVESSRQSGISALQSHDFLSYFDFPLYLGASRVVGMPLRLALQSFRALRNFRPVWSGGGYKTILCNMTGQSLDSFGLHRLCSTESVHTSLFENLHKNGKISHNTVCFCRAAEQKLNKSLRHFRHDRHY